MELTDLPDEMLELIIKPLCTTPKGVRNLALVSKQFRDLAYSVSPEFPPKYDPINHEYTLKNGQSIQRLEKDRFDIHLSKYLTLDYRPSGYDEENNFPVTSYRGFIRNSVLSRVSRPFYFSIAPVCMMDSDQVINPQSRRLVRVGGAVYKKLIMSGVMQEKPLFKTRIYCRILIAIDDTHDRQALTDLLVHVKNTLFPRDKDTEVDACEDGLKLCCQIPIEYYERVCFDLYEMVLFKLDPDARRWKQWFHTILPEVGQNLVISGVP